MFIGTHICACVCGLFTAMYIIIVRLLHNNSLQNYVMLLFNHNNAYWMLAIYSVYVLSYFKLSKLYHYVLYMTMFKGKCFMVDTQSLICREKFHGIVDRLATNVFKIVTHKGVMFACHVFTSQYDAI